jgi:hypothetical protein
MLTITVTDETGTVLGTKDVPEDDYFVLTTGRCTSHTVAHANGTHVVTFKGRTPAAGPPARPAENKE